MPSHDIANLWKRLEAWLAVHAPESLETLAPGASEAQIEAIESALSIKLPLEYRDSCLIHDGQTSYTSDTGDSRRFFNAYWLMTLETIEADWKVWKTLLDDGSLDEFESEPVGPVRPNWWNPQWLAFSTDDSGDFTGLDLDPDEGGTVGQVISFVHDDGVREVLFPSFGAWLSAIVEGCESGQFVYSSEYRSIIDPNEWD